MFVERKYVVSPSYRIIYIVISNSSRFYIIFRDAMKNRPPPNLIIWPFFFPFNISINFWHNNQYVILRTERVIYLLH